MEKVIYVLAAIVVVAFVIWETLQVSKIMNTLGESIETTQKLAATNQELVASNNEILLGQVEALKETSALVESNASLPLRISDEYANRYRNDIQTMMTTFETVSNRIESDLRLAEEKIDVARDRVVVRDALDAALEVFDAMASIAFGMNDVHDGVIVTARLQEHVILNDFMDRMLEMEGLIRHFEEDPIHSQAPTGSSTGNAGSGDPEPIAPEDIAPFYYSQTRLLEERHVFAAAKIKIGLARHGFGSERPLGVNEYQRQKLLAEASALIERYYRTYSMSKESIERLYESRDSLWRLFPRDQYPVGMDVPNPGSGESNERLRWEFERCQMYHLYLVGLYMKADGNDLQAHEAFSIARDLDPANPYCDSCDEAKKKTRENEAKRVRQYRFTNADINYMLSLEKNSVGEPEEIAKEIYEIVRGIHKLVLDEQRQSRPQELVLLYMVYETMFLGSVYGDTEMNESMDDVFDRFDTVFKQLDRSEQTTHVDLQHIMIGHKLTLEVIEGNFDYTSPGVLTPHKSLSALPAKELYLRAQVDVLDEIKMAVEHRHAELGVTSLDPVTVAALKEYIDEIARIVVEEENTERYGYWGYPSSVFERIKFRLDRIASSG